MSWNQPTVTEVFERPFVKNTQKIEALARMSDGSEMSLAAFYPNNRIMCCGLEGLATYEVLDVMGKRFHNWLMAS